MWPYRAIKNGLLKPIYATLLKRYAEVGISADFKQE